MSTEPPPRPRLNVSPILIAVLMAGTYLWMPVTVLSVVANAQGTPAITSSGLNTQVSAPIPVPGGTTQFNITGGHRPENGPNLFHSFGNFNVPANNIANFLNETPALATTNILGRVTGGNVSSIFGTIQTTGFGNANLFLMNPAGFLFGPTATLNVGGMVTFTSADYLRFSDNARFNAVPNMAADALLSMAPVAAFGFLGTSPGAITVQGGQLSVIPGKAISLVGGDITIEGATLGPNNIQPSHLSAPGGQINLASVASPGEVPASNFQVHPTMTGGAITLSQGSTLDVSANAAGTVRIRGGQLVMENATIMADTVTADATPTAIDIDITGTVSIVDTRGAPALTARTTGTGDAGTVQIKSTNLEVTSNALPLFTLIDTHTSGRGDAGDITIATTDNLNVTGRSTGRMFFIDSGTIGAGGGQGGDLTITGENIKLENTRINTGDFVARNTFGEAAGSGGNVTIQGDKVVMNLALIATDGFFEGKAGDLSITARDIQMTRFSQLSLLEFGGGGKLTINTDRLVTDSAQFDSETVAGPGGGISITGRIVEIKNGTTLRSQTVGDGAAGDITITATDSMTLSDDPATLGARTRPTGLFTNSLGNAGLGDKGNAGSIVITTPRLTMSGGARIDSSTQSTGRGGNVVITAADSVSVAGERPTPVLEQELFGLGSSRSSGIFTRTVGQEFCTGACGDAGSVSITTGMLSLGSGTQINSGTTSTGRGGDVTISVSNVITLSGSLSDGSAAGIFSRTVGAAPNSGPGGDIALTAGQSFTLSDGASVAASSTGPGNAGNITIDAGQTFTSTNSSVTTEAAQASGGNITVLATDSVRLTNSQLNASVQGSETTVSGNITIDPQAVILQNSQIVAQATQGQGGNISITTQSFLADATSVIDASSQFGISGTVNIQSPTQQMAGRLIALPANPLTATALLSQRCAALTSGQFSSFVVAGRYGLPPDPGGWLASPFMPDEPGGSAAEDQAEGSWLVRTVPGSRSEPDSFSIRRWPGSGATALNPLLDRTTGCGS